jgi:hypothetical protein
MLLAVCLLCGCAGVRTTWLLTPPSWAGMERINDQLVVERGTPPELIARWQQDMKKAEGRLEELLGSVHSRPVFYFCHSEPCYQGFGGGMPRAKAFGQSRVLFSPRGQSVDFVVHEWWHAEFKRRVGSFQVYFHVPPWFDEGMAVSLMQTDSNYAEAMYEQVLKRGITPPTLSELATHKGFYRAIARFGDDKVAAQPDAPGRFQVVYPTMGHEVRRWLATVGRTGLHDLLHRVQNGEDFQSAYEAVETQAPSSKPASIVN